MCHLNKFYFFNDFFFEFDLVLEETVFFKVAFFDFRSLKLDFGSTTFLVLASGFFKAPFSITFSIKI